MTKKTEIDLKKRSRENRKKKFNKHMARFIKVKKTENNQNLQAQLIKKC